MDQITHEVRLARWKEVIGQCQLRPEGQSIKDWCKQNDVSEKRYYYWQRRIRLQIAEGMSGSLVPAAGNERPVMFTEIPVPAHDTGNSALGQTADFQPEAVIRKGDLVIAVKNSVSDRLLDRLLEGVSHAR